MKPSDFLFSHHVFNPDVGTYNVSVVLNDTTFQFNGQGYDAYSKINLSIFFAYAYGLSFATLAATLSHVALFHGRYFVYMKRVRTFCIKNFPFHETLTILYIDHFVLSKVVLPSIFAFPYAEQSGNNQGQHSKTSLRMCTLD